jgi:hypothetical protein
VSDVHVPSGTLEGYIMVFVDSACAIYVLNEARCISSPSMSSSYKPQAEDLREDQSMSGLGAPSNCPLTSPFLFEVPFARLRIWTKKHVPPFRSGWKNPSIISTPSELQY